MRDAEGAVAVAAINALVQVPLTAMRWACATQPGKPGKKPGSTCLASGISSH